MKKIFFRHCRPDGIRKHRRLMQRRRHEGRRENSRRRSQGHPGDRQRRRRNHPHPESRNPARKRLGQDRGMEIRTPEIATVDPETGVVTGVTEGEAEILALCGGKNGKGGHHRHPGPDPCRKDRTFEDRTGPVRRQNRETDLHDQPENATNQEAAWIRATRRLRPSPTMRYRDGPE